MSSLFPTHHGGGEGGIKVGEAWDNCKLMIKKIDLTLRRGSSRWLGDGVGLKR